MTLTYSPKDFDVFIGIDTDKGSFSFTARDHYTMKRSKKIPSDCEHFYNYIQKQFPGRKVICAYEAGPTGYHLYDYLTEKRIRCLVVSPSSLPKPANERVKTNRIDSEKISEYLRSGQLHSIRVPQGPWRQLRYLVAARETYALMRKATKQRIKGLILLDNLHKTIKASDTKWSARYVNEFIHLECSEAVRTKLDMLLSDLAYVRKQLASIMMALRQFCQDHSIIHRYMRFLESIPGIGFTTAVSLLARIGNPYFLRNVRELGGFLGLIPCERSTGDNVNRGPITHLGNKMLRSLLIEVAWIAIQKDAGLRMFYHRVRNRHHVSYAGRKAITAVARKMTQIIYAVLKEQRMYISYS